MNFDPTEPWTGLVKRWTVMANVSQPRVSFDTEALKKLAASLKRKQRVPCSVIRHSNPDFPHVEWMLIDGERRWRAAEIAGLEDLWVAYDPAVTMDSIHEASLTANFCREGHTKMEVSNAVQREITSGKAEMEVAAMVGKSLSWVMQYLSLQRLHPVLQALLDADDKQRRVSFSVVLELVNHPMERQLVLWEKVKRLRPLEAVHKVRTTNVASANRTQSGNTRYIAGRVSAALTQLRQLNEIGEVMMRAITPTKAAEMVTKLSELRASAKAFMARCEARAEETESAGGVS